MWAQARTQTCAHAYTWTHTDSSSAHIPKTTHALRHLPQWKKPAAAVAGCHLLLKHWLAPASQGSFWGWPACPLFHSRWGLAQRCELAVTQLRLRGSCPCCLDARAWPAPHCHREQGQWQRHLPRWWLHRLRRKSSNQSVNQSIAFKQSTKQVISLDNFHKQGCPSSAAHVLKTMKCLKWSVNCLQWVNLEDEQ